MGKRVFMIVGGNHYNHISIQKAKELGLAVLVVDGRSGLPSAKMADYFVKEDITNVAAVEKIARKYRIIGAMTRNEKAVQTVCYINERLGLPKQGTRLGDKITDKAVMREIFLRNGVRSVRFFTVEDEDDQQLVKKLLMKWLPRTPFIVKPTDRAGANGVTKVEQIEKFDEAVEVARNAGRNGKIIVEEFVEGQEVGAQCLCVRGKMVLCLLSKKFVSPDLKTVGHAYPVDLPLSQIKEIKRECRKALKCLGVRNGPTTIDIRINRSGEPFIVDIGARAGGNRLPELIACHTGIDFVKESVRLAVGKKVRLPVKRKVPAALLHLHFHKPGVVKSVKPYRRLVKKYNPTDIMLNLHEGMKVGPKYQSHGYLLCKGKDAVRRCSVFIRKIKRSIEWREA